MTKKELDLRVSVITEITKPGTVLTIREALDKFEGVDPIPGNYILLKLRPKITGKAMVNIDHILRNESNLSEWLHYTDHNPLLFLVVAVGSPLATADGNKEHMAFEKGDIVYGDAYGGNIKPLIHNKLVGYVTMQRNLFCKTPYIPVFEGEEESRAVPPPRKKI